MNNPKVTVLMPVFNGGRYISDAIDSILSQTFHDFEFLIINDGSTDQSVDIILSYQDKRIRIIHNESNMGIVSTLNKGIDLANGEYIARMDCDDISMPKRLEKQVYFMDNNPEIGVCGTWFKYIGSKKIYKLPISHEEIKCNLLIRTSMAHPTIMFRKEILLRNNFYYEKKYENAEDYRLWTRCINITKLVNLPEALLRYRIHSDQISKIKKQNQSKKTDQIVEDYLKLIFTISSESMGTIKKFLLFSNYSPTTDMLSQGHNFLCSLSSENNRISTFPRDEFNVFIAERWFEMCWISSLMGYYTWQNYKRSELRKSSNIPFITELKLFIKCLIRMGNKK